MAVSLVPIWGTCQTSAPVMGGFPTCRAMVLAWMVCVPEEATAQPVCRALGRHDREQAEPGRGFRVSAVAMPGLVSPTCGRAPMVPDRDFPG